MQLKSCEFFASDAFIFVEKNSVFLKPWLRTAIFMEVCTCKHRHTLVCNMNFFLTKNFSINNWKHCPIQSSLFTTSCNCFPYLTLSTLASSLFLSICLRISVLPACILSETQFILRTFYSFGFLCLLGNLAPFLFVIFKSPKV